MRLKLFRNWIEILYVLLLEFVVDMTDFVRLLCIAIDGLKHIEIFEAKNYLHCTNKCILEWLMYQYQSQNFKLDLHFFIFIFFKHGIFLVDFGVMVACFFDWWHAVHAIIVFNNYNNNTFQGICLIWFVEIYYFLLR